MQSDEYTLTPTEAQYLESLMVPGEQAVQIALKMLFQSRELGDGNYNWDRANKKLVKQA
jgi:hypothetical protein